MSAVTQPVIACCFEAGTSGSAVMAGGGFNASLGTADGAQFDAVSLSGASTLNYSSAVAHSGTLSCQVSTPSTADCFLLWEGSGLIINATAQVWFRLYLYQAANPASVHQLAQAGVAGSRAGDLVINANGTLSMRNAAGTVILTTVTAVPLGAWYRIEGYVTSSATTGQMEMKLFISPDSTTPAETQTSAANLNTLGGNISQMRYGPSSTGVTGLVYYMDDVAMSTAGYVGPGPVVFHMAAGAPTDAGFTVCSKPVSATSVRLKVATDPGLTQNVAWVAAVIPDQYGYVQHVVTGMAPSTVYYCQLADTPPGGTEALCGPVAQCKTLPPPGYPASFRVALASCINTANETPDPVIALTDWIGWAADLNVFTGDYDYQDPTETTVTGQLGNIEYQTMYWLGAPVTSSAWGYYCRSDHDSTTDGGDSDNTWTAANLLAMQEAFPFASPLPDPDNPVHGLWQSWVTGRVRFIMTDIRNTDRSPSANPDNASKTMLGANQLAWLYGQLVMPEPLKVIITDTSWIGNSTGEDSCGPSWTYYTTERGAILDFIAANTAAVQNVMLWHGDAHGVAYCAAEDNPDGGFPVYCAAPLRQTGAAFEPVAATFTDSYYNAGGECRQYGRISVTDTGSQISVNFQGWDAVNAIAQIEQADTFSAPPGGGNTSGLVAVIASTL